jgi:hypothetical protein
MRSTKTWQSLADWEFGDPSPRVIARSAATWQSLADIGGQAVPKALPSAPPGQEDDQSHEIGRGVVDQRHLPSVSLSMVDLMRWTMMRSTTSLPPVISMLGTFGFRSGNLRFAPIFCSSNLRFHYRAISASVDIHCGAISLRSMFRVGRKKAGWQSRRWRINIVKLTIYSQFDYNLCWGERGHLDVAATLLQGGKGEIKTPRSSGQALAWRSRSPTASS